jgi:hypothetical protein
VRRFENSIRFSPEILLYSRRAVMRIGHAADAGIEKPPADRSPKEGQSHAAAEYRDRTPWGRVGNYAAFTRTLAGAVIMARLRARPKRFLRPITSIFLTLGADGPPRVRHFSKILVATGFVRLERKAGARRQTRFPACAGTARPRHPAGVDVNDRIPPGLDPALFPKIARVFTAV